MSEIECRDLRKAYGDVRALDGVSFRAEAGKVLALLGSNGSGKTTTVRIMTTLTAPDSGAAQIDGKDVVREAAEVREVIGLTTQETVIDRFLTAHEYMNLVAQMRHMSRPRRTQEVTALLAEFDLDDVANARVGGYSGGMRRRLDIAASFLGRPKVLLLDEPSTGLDPDSRRRLWDAIRHRAENGATILLTTQYMEEADALADLVVVLAHGRVIATATPSELKDDTGSRVVELTFSDLDNLERAASTLATMGIQRSSGEAPEALSFQLPRSGAPLLAILQRLEADGATAPDVIVRRPTLDEAFLRLTRTVGDTPEGEQAEAESEVVL